MPVTGTGPQTQGPRRSHYGTAAMNPWIANRAHPGSGHAPSGYGPGGDGLTPWLGVPITRQGALRSVQLDNLGILPRRLVGFAACMHRATVDRATWQQISRRSGLLDPTGWGQRYEGVVQQRFVDVPLWSVLGPPRATSGLNRNQFRKTQPFVKAQALAQALANSAQAILRSRGANG